MGDFNGDGKLDLVVTNSNSNTISVLLGNGDGTFQTMQTYATGNYPFAVAVGDFNHDGAIDLVVTNVNDYSIGVLLGNGDGTFQTQQTYDIGGVAYSVAVGDLNRDGKLDIVVGNEDGTAGVLLGKGDGTFQAQQKYPAGNDPRALTIGDINSDGKLDVVALNRSTNAFVVLLGNGDGTLQAPQTYPTGNYPRSIAVGDFNGDGALDVTTANSNDKTVSVLLNVWSVQAVATGVNVPGQGETHSVFGAYGGDSTYAASNSNSVDLISANGFTTSVALSSSDNPSTFGELVTFTAAVTRNGNGIPTGTVTFADASVTLGTGTLDSSGHATYTTSTLALGSHLITAAYGGDADDLGSTSSALTQQVNAVNPNALRFIAVTPCRTVDTRPQHGGHGAIFGNTSQSFVIPGTCGIPTTAAAFSLNITVVPHGSLGYLTVWPTGLAQPLVSTLNSVDGRVKANAAIVPAGANGAISVFANMASTASTDVIVDINGYFVPASNTNALAFYPLTPCRVVDTRLATGPLGGPNFTANQTRDFPLLSSTNCSIPSTAQAYSVNFTVVPTKTLGYLTAWPADQAQPTVSTLNDTTGTIVANAAIVPAAQTKGNGFGIGDIKVFVTDATAVIIDINGYFAPSNKGGESLYTVTPCRVLDTRKGKGAFNGQLVPPLDVTAGPCGIPGAAQAFVFNATVVPQAPLGFLALWPDGLTRPLVSTLNAFDGAITNNMAIVPTNNGSIDAYGNGLTNLLLDISSYFAP